MNGGGNSSARLMAEPHRRAFLDRIEAAASRGRYAAVRARALYTLAWSSALRLSEALALDVGDVVEPISKADLYKARIRIVSTFELEAHKAKGGNGGPVVIPRAARDAIRDYLYLRMAEDEETGEAELDVLERAWRSRPLFVTGRGRGSERTAGARLPKRAAQADFTRWQRIAGVEPAYRWHDLRHTAITRFAELAKGDPYKVAAFARHRDIRTSQRYVHVQQLAQVAEQL